MIYIGTPQWDFKSFQLVLPRSTALSKHDILIYQNISNQLIANRMRHETLP